MPTEWMLFVVGFFAGILVWNLAVLDATKESKETFRGRR